MGHFIPAACQDVIEVRRTSDDPQWYAYFLGELAHTKERSWGPWPTPAEALRAARAAYWGVVIDPTAAYGGALWNAWDNDGTLIAGECDTPDAALIAAIDARDAKGGG